MDELSALLDAEYAAAPNDAPAPPTPTTIPSPETGALTLRVPRMLTVQNRMWLLHTVLDAADAGVRELVLDLRDTVYVDSSGLSAFTELRRVLVRELGGALRLVNVSPELRLLFEAVRLDGVLELEPAARRG